MFKRVFITIVFFSILFASTTKAQVAPNTYWIEFTDKNNSPYSTDRPHEFLSEKAIHRRLKQSIAITHSDLPVTPHYVDSLKALGMSIHNTSKWLNGVVAISSDSVLLDTIHKLSFVKHTPLLKSSKTPNNLNHSAQKKATAPNSTSALQLSMLKLNYLHDNNIQGADILIGVLDSGFENADSLESFQHLWNENRIIAIADFVKDGANIFETHYHGTIVTSIIGGYWQDMHTGAAPKANYALIRTEDANSEYLIEEYNWVSGAEYADSLGVDVINSSLGYSEFDDSTQNHNYADLDGKTTPISIAAALAARKGIIVVTSAGNSGNKNWHYITAPADADSVLTVGAVNNEEQITDFSSRGPTADNRIKPDVSAMGKNTIGQKQVGKLSTCTGTSCSSPLIAGLAASLLSAYPHCSAQEIIKAIKESSNYYNTPNNEYGYGIPNAVLASEILESISDSTNKLTNIRLFPNPTKHNAYVIIEIPWLKGSSEGDVTLIDLKGSQLHKNIVPLKKGLNIFIVEQTSLLEPGYYIYNVVIEGRMYSLPFIKID